MNFHPPSIYTPKGAYDYYLAFIFLALFGICALFVGAGLVQLP
ncbi:hypothetical protein [Halegenticoccus tardaugens]|nr:hypothetical protein [Halegenticoccus tardaugens]